MSEAVTLVAASFICNRKCFRISYYINKLRKLAEAWLTGAAGAYIGIAGGCKMRLDKYLKVSRLIKRRSVANEACDAGRVLVNDKPAKASVNVKVGDVLTIQFGNKEVKVEVLNAQETVKKEEAAELFRYL